MDNNAGKGRKRASSANPPNKNDKKKGSKDSTGNKKNSKDDTAKLLAAVPVPSISAQPAPENLLKPPEDPNDKSRERTGSGVRNFMKAVTKSRQGSLTNVKKEPKSVIQQAKSQVASPAVLIAAHKKAIVEDLKKSQNQKPLSIKASTLRVTSSHQSIFGVHGHRKKHAKKKAAGRTNFKTFMRFMGVGRGSSINELSDVVDPLEYYVTGPMETDLANADLSKMAEALGPIRLQYWFSIFWAYWIIYLHLMPSFNIGCWNYICQEIPRLYVQTALDPVYNCHEHNWYYSIPWVAGIHVIISLIGAAWLVKPDKGNWVTHYLCCKLKFLEPRVILALIPHGLIIVAYLLQLSEATKADAVIQRHMVHDLRELVPNVALITQSQAYLECCGMHNYTDWNKYISKYPEIGLPFTCCNKVHCFKPLKLTDAYKEGCYTKELRFARLFILIYTVPMIIMLFANFFIFSKMYLVLDEIVATESYVLPPFR